jgi:hypothetical protein
MLTPGYETTTATPVAAWERGLDREPLPGGLEPWTVLPGQFLDGARAMQLSGEKRLMAAVLADAMQLYLKHHRSCTASGRILFRETERWFESQDRSWLLSFENVCDVLGIDAGRLRQALRAQAASGTRFRLPVDAGRLRVARGRKIRV